MRIQSPTKEVKLINLDFSRIYHRVEKLLKYIFSYIKVLINYHTEPLVTKSDDFGLISDSGTAILKAKVSLFPSETVPLVDCSFVLNFKQPSNCW